MRMAVKFLKSCVKNKYENNDTKLLWVGKQ